MVDLSVIIPVYNSEKTIEKCLKSIIKQSFINFEVILIDDGSVDNSLQLLELYKSMDKRFKVIKESNSGVSKARNIGLQNSIGKWVIFIDSDDWVEPKYFEVLIKTALKHNLDIVQIRRIDEKDDGSYRQKVNQKEYLIITSFNDFLPDNSNFYGSCWGFLFKRKILDGLYFDENISFAEDALFSVEAMNRSKRIGILNEYLYHYNMTVHNSLSQGKYDEKKYTLIASRKKQLRLFKNNVNGYNIMRARLADACFYIYDLGKNDPSFMRTHYNEVSSLFREHFRYWNIYRGGRWYTRLIRHIYKWDLRIGYKLRNVLCIRK